MLAFSSVPVATLEADMESFRHHKYVFIAKVYEILTCVKDVNETLFSDIVSLALEIS